VIAEVSITKQQVVLAWGSRRRGVRRSVLALPLRAIDRAEPLEPDPRSVLSGGGFHLRARLAWTAGSALEGELPTGVSVTGLPYLHRRRAEANRMNLQTIATLRTISSPIRDQLSRIFECEEMLLAVGQAGQLPPHAMPTIQPQAHRASWG
jgi:hypothetical protein